MATGLIGVSTRHCDIPELLIHGETSRLADEGDVEGIARELRWVADHPEAWSGLTRAARHRVEAEYDLVVQCARMSTLYHEVVRPYKNKKGNNTLRTKNKYLNKNNISNIDYINKTNLKSQLRTGFRSDRMSSTRVYIETKW